MAKRATFEGKTYLVPDGATDQEVIDYVESQAGVGPSPIATGQSMLATRAGMAGNQLRTGLLNALPAAGGLGGGIVGGPLGAMAGGAAGEGLRMAFGGESMRAPGPPTSMRYYGGPLGPIDLPPSIVGPLTQMGTSAAEQGAAEAAGLGIGKAMTGTARAMMRGALRPSLKMARVAKTLPADALAEGGVVTMRGVGKMSQKVGASAGRTQRLLERARRAGAEILPADVVPTIDDLVSPQTPKLAEARAEAQKLIDSYLDSHAAAKTPGEAKLQKKISWDEAQLLLERASTPGKRITQAQPLEARFHLMLADNLKNALEAIPQYGKRIGRSEARTSKLINVRDALNAAEVQSRSGISPLMPQTIGRSAMATAGGVAGYSQPGSPGEKIGRGAAGTLIGGALATPQALSTMAHIPNNEILQFIISRLGPHAATMLFPQYGPPPDSTQAPRRY